MKASLGTEKMMLSFLEILATFTTALGKAGRLK